MFFPPRIDPKKVREDWKKKTWYFVAFIAAAKAIPVVLHAVETFKH